MCCRDRLCGSDACGDLGHTSDGVHEIAVWSETGRVPTTRSPISSSLAGVRRQPPSRMRLAHKHVRHLLLSMQLDCTCRRAKCDCDVIYCGLLNCKGIPIYERRRMTINPSATKTPTVSAAFFQSLIIIVTPIAIPKETSNLMCVCVCRNNAGLRVRHEPALSPNARLDRS